MQPVCVRATPAECQLTPKLSDRLSGPATKGQKDKRTCQAKRARFEQASQQQQKQQKQQKQQRRQVSNRHRRTGRYTRHPAKSIEFLAASVCLFYRRVTFLGRLVSPFSTCLSTREYYCSMSNQGQKPGELLFKKKEESTGWGPGRFPSAAGLMISAAGPAFHCSRERIH